MVSAVIWLGWLFYNPSEAATKHSYVRYVSSTLRQHRNADNDWQFHLCAKWWLNAKDLCLMRAQASHQIFISSSSRDMTWHPRVFRNCQMHELVPQATRVYVTDSTQIRGISGPWQLALSTSDFAEEFTYRPSLDGIELSQKHGYNSCG